MKKQTTNKTPNGKTRKTTAQKPQNATTAPEKTTPAPAAFPVLLSDFEKAYAAGDYAAELYALSRSIVFACLRKVIDPQRKAAQGRDSVSNSGLSPALVSLRRGVAHDKALLDNTANAAAAAYAVKFNANGDANTEKVNKAAAVGLDELLEDTISDGQDLVHDCAAALLEQAAAHANAGEGWTERPYTVRRLARKVYIKTTDSAAYREEETTPIQEVYRAVRRSIEQSRAAKTDPANGHIYIDGQDPETLDTVYFRLGKAARIDGQETAAARRPGDYIPGQPTEKRPAEAVTVDRETVDDLQALLDRLELTTNQRRIVELRLRGYGEKAVATYLGVTKQAVQNALHKVQKKAAAVGLVPAAK